MYQEKNNEQLEFDNFYLPFSGKLNKENRWIKLSQLIPWDDIEKIYMEKFSPNHGAPAKPLRMALGSLLIKEKCGFTDEETVEQIKENPYLQYFIGMNEYSNKEPFEASMMVHFRKRLSSETMSEINEMITGVKREEKSDEKNNSDDEDPEPKNNGKLLVDASCAPSDIRYPNDVSLLNEARENTEKIIDRLCKVRGEKKPRTYRKIARKEFLRFIHAKKPDRKKVKRAIGKQLQYVGRNLKNIEKMADSLEILSRREYKNLLVIQELYRQQKAMYDAKTNRIESRIVSISQPHVRPIVRGKAGSPVEFGAKIEVSLVDGYAFIDNLSWENFNESVSLKDQIEKYKIRYGSYPESVHADKIFRTRANREFCKLKGIRLSGPPLGRPAAMSKEEKSQSLKDDRIRNAIEGKFGQGKRRFGLGLIMAKLQETSETVIWVNILVMNLERRLAIIFNYLLCRLIAVLKIILRINTDAFNMHPVIF
jgi:hypothetical protein